LRRRPGPVRCGSPRLVLSYWRRPRRVGGSIDHVGIGADPHARGRPAVPLSYRPELDAVRGIAVLLVIGGHLYVPGLLGGGNVGVTLFFVLSGYLITSILRDNGSLVRFYTRRARRLLPALVVWLGVMVVTGVVTVGETLPPLTFVANWTAATGYLAMPLWHTWSLAVEEQFYLAWPLLLAVVWRPVWLIVAMIAVTAAAGMLAQSEPTWGEVGRFGAIAWGCLLGLGVVPQLPRSLVLAAVALLVFLVVFPLAPIWANRVGPLLSASCFAVLAVLLRRRTGPLAFRPLMAIGRISYGLYLWHAPFAVAIWPRLFDGQDRAGDLLSTLAVVAATFGCATLSWFLVERPFLQAGFRSRDRHVSAMPVPAVAAALP
jgi:peptidoglycan/LPS O-acetylase OafA/YrhL